CLEELFEFRVVDLAVLAGCRAVRASPVLRGASGPFTGPLRLMSDCHKCLPVSTRWVPASPSIGLVIARQIAVETARRFSNRNSESQNIPRVPQSDKAGAKHRPNGPS